MAAKTELSVKLPGGPRYFVNSGRKKNGRDRGYCNRFWISTNDRDIPNTYFKKMISRTILNELKRMPEVDAAMYCDKVYRAAYDEWVSKS